MDLVVAEKYYDIYFFPVEKIMLIHWKVKVLDLSLIEYREIMIRAYDYLSLLKPDFLIQDGSDAVFPTTAEANNWIVENISPRFAQVGLKKIAYIIPRDKLTLEGLEKMIDKSLKVFPQVERKLFPDMNKAMAWIKDNS